MGRIVKPPKERRREIVSAAARLFRSNKYHQVTMVDVMEEVGIAKGTIYHYFKSKKELLQAVIDEMVEERMGVMREIVDGANGNALDKIKRIIEGSDASIKESALLSHLHEPGNEAMHIRLLAATLLKQAHLYSQIIQQGVVEGVFHTNNPLESAEFILAGFQFLTDVGIYPWSKVELQRRGRALPKLIEQQLKAPPGSFDFMSPKKGKIIKR